MDVVKEIIAIKKQLHKLWCMLSNQPTFDQDNIPRVHKFAINLSVAEGNDELFKATKVLDIINNLQPVIQEREIHYFQANFNTEAYVLSETYIVQNKGKGKLENLSIGELVKISEDNPPVEVPVIDGISVGTGVPLYAGLENKKIKTRSLSAGNGIRFTVINDTITISTPQSGSSGNSDWYLDSSYTRPTDGSWEATEYIDGVPLPAGTLSDPLITYEEFLLKYIGSPNGSNGNGNFSKINPRWGGVKLQILSTVYTSSDIEVIYATLRLQSGANLVYTGSRDYALDFQELWNMMPRIGGIIARPVYMNLAGEGTFTRTDYNGTPRFGLVRIKMSSTETNSSIGAGFGWYPEGAGINIVESENANSGIYQPLTREDGTTLLFNGNIQVFGTTQAPVVPLIYIDGCTFQYWSSSVVGTKLFIITNTQKGLVCINEGSISASNDRIKYQVQNSKIGYQKKMYRTGTPGNYTYFPAGLTTEERQLVDEREGLYYKPHDEYCIYHAENEGVIRLENIGTEPNGFIHAGANAVVLLKNKGKFYNVSSCADIGGGGASNLIRCVGADNYAEFNNGQIYSKLNNFVKGDGTNTIGVVLRNIGVFSINNIKQDVTLNIYTGGTLSSIKDNPIISMAGYATEANAVSAGLINGMLYRNSDTDIITQINQ